ncbi:MAG TPA: LUD domain-containing protein [Stellaceae bacterium]|nr:LUD domain-containing protein [Stellaceae bacterium]
MSAREAILAALKVNRPAGDFPLPDVPSFEEAYREPSKLFPERLALMGGTMAALQPGEDWAGLVRRLYPDVRLVCSTVPEVEGTCRITDFATPQEAQYVELGIVRAAFGVAETGSVCLTEAQLGMNAFPHLCEHLLVLLDPAQVLPNIHSAYRRPEIARARYAVLHSGPSATADIQGVMVRGAQGVRSLTVIYV